MSLSLVSVTSYSNQSLEPAEQAGRVASVVEQAAKAGTISQSGPREGGAG